MRIPLKRTPCIQNRYPYDPKEIKWWSYESGRFLMLLQAAAMKFITVNFNLVFSASFWYKMKPKKLVVFHFFLKKRKAVGVLTVNQREIVFNFRLSH